MGAYCFDLFFNIRYTFCFKFERFLISYFVFDEQYTWMDLILFDSSFHRFKIVLDSLLTIYEFSFISKVDTAFLKKVFSVSATLSSFCINSSFSMSFIWDLRFVLSEKNGFIVFQKMLLSLTKDGLRLLKNSFLSFL